MENLMGGTEALRMLGESPKKGAAVKILKKFGIVPVYSKNTGRGTATFVKKEDVEAALLNIERERAAKLLKQRDFVSAGERTRFVPTVDVLESIKRLETKVDRLLMMWGDKNDA